MSELDDIFTDLKHITDCILAYRRIINMPNCNDCGIKDCEVKPKWYDPIRYNCPLWREREDGDTQ